MKHMSYLGLPFIKNKMILRYKRSKKMREKYPRMSHHYLHDEKDIESLYYSKLFASFHIKNLYKSTTYFIEPFKGSLQYVNYESLFGPTVEEETVEEDPVEEDPVKEDPVKEDPVEEDPVKEDPVEEEIGQEEPVEEDPVEEDPVEEDPVEEDPVEEEPVEEDPVK
jgi:hypothetical protein